MTKTRAMAPRIAIAALLLAGFGSYAWGALHAPWMDSNRPAQLQLARQVIKEADQRNDMAERRLSEDYWTRYPDVAADAYFGRNGKLGIQGAHEHYQRHGRHEGRVWGPDADAPATSDPAKPK